MSGVISLSEEAGSRYVRAMPDLAHEHLAFDADSGPDEGAFERVRGVGRLGVQCVAGRSRLRKLYQEGACRLRMPRALPGAALEAVTINTAGGLTGGDRLDLAVALDAGARAIVTSQACEKIYRSSGGEARVGTAITLARASRLDWLAQPMIVFDRARIRRTLDIDMAEDARLLAVDGIILGRGAMGEQVRTGSIHDGWRIRRAGRLVVGDAFRAGPRVAASLSGRASANAGRGLATIIDCAPDAEDRLAEARLLIPALAGEAAASAWNGCLVVRLVCDDGQQLMDDLARFLIAYRGEPLPRSWSC